MKPAALRPAAHVLVCTNARAPDDPLRSGCGRAGAPVVAALKRAVLARGAGVRVWITATGCLGHCPPEGCSAVLYPRGEHLVAVTTEDVPELLRRALADAAT